MTAISNDDFIARFDSSLCFDDAIRSAIFRGERLGVAVSGGADSMALLTALLHLFGAKALAVLTVNHNIRPEAESKGDADFVSSYCASCGVAFRVHTIPRGMVKETAEKRGKGIEEAARFLRYQAFRQFAKEENLCAVSLAHNQNDQLETLVMRFLQGSSASQGIAFQRDVFIRPMLLIPRADIERYLRLQGISWRTDATNSDTQYLRNAIRHTLLPALDGVYPGWRRAVLSGAEKSSDDNDYLEAEAGKISWEKNGAQGLSLPASFFYALPAALRRRALYRALTALQTDSRFPYTAVRTVISPDFAVSGRLEAAGIVCHIKKDRLYVKKQQKKATETGFLGILTERGKNCVLCGIVFAVNDDGVLTCLEPDESARAVCRVSLPACIRSVQAQDVVSSPDGNPRSVSGLFSAWHVAQDERCQIPVVQELAAAGQPIVCVLGSLCGKPDWIEKERKL